VGLVSLYIVHAFSCADLGLKREPTLSMRMRCDSAAAERQLGARRADFRPAGSRAEDAPAAADAVARHKPTNSATVICLDMVAGGLGPSIGSLSMRRWWALVLMEQARVTAGF